VRIKTDFIPKIGDTVKVKNSFGYRVCYIWMACPNCGLERWVMDSNSKTSTFTGLCKKCNILRLKKEYNW